MLATPVQRAPLHLLRCSSLKPLVLLFLAAILLEQGNLICKKINTELWCEILVE